MKKECFEHNLIITQFIMEHKSKKNMSVLHALCLAQYPAKSARFLHQTSQETSYS